MTDFYKGARERLRVPYALGQEILKALEGNNETP